MLARRMSGVQIHGESHDSVLEIRTVTVETKTVQIEVQADQVIGLGKHIDIPGGCVQDSYKCEADPPPCVPEFAQQC